MGSVYCGPFADAAGAYDHEGYADRLMPSGEFSNGEWSPRFPADAHVAFLAACACGWRGTTEHPPTDQGERLALDQWERDHLWPLVDRAARRYVVTADRLLTFIRSVRGSLPTTVNDHGEAVLTDRGHGVCDALDQLEHCLDTLSEGH